MKDQILNIAQDARKWAENARHAKLGIPRNLQGMCAIASAELHLRLNTAGIPSKFIMSRTVKFSHVYLLVEDYVLDITATQFGGTFRNKKVVYMHEREADLYPQYFPDVEFHTIEELRDFQVKYGWPIDQQISIP